ncbi:protein-disulfide reductase DsbD [Marinicella sp. W31]|uniref:protein-disulfide reductase DsbD n=1 Tax=Marinicella sp. W31 TaxID=3023713 RepID=UPI0037572515
MIKTKQLLSSAALIWMLFPLLLQAAIDPDEILSADEAFIPTVEAQGDAINLVFEIAEDYYLYKHAFEFSATGMVLGEADIPQGKRKTDEFFGEVETYRQQMQIRIPVLEVSGPAELTYRYQGCADAGICYPPKRKTVAVSLPVSVNSGGSDVLGLNQNSGSFFGQPNIRPESEAFTVEAIALDATALSVRFSMLPDIYLYQDQIKFTSQTDGVVLGEVQFPEAVMKDDPEFGMVKVFWDLVEIPVTMVRTKSTKKLRLLVDFQGCVDGEICYPPAQRTIDVDLPDYTPTAADQKMAAQIGSGSEQGEETQVLSEQQQLTQSIADEGWWLTVIQFFGFGLLLSLTPCVFPMIPILSGLIVGQKNISTSRAFTLSLVYVLAMALTYTAVGVIAGLLGANLTVLFQKPWVVITFCAIFVLLAISMFGFFELQLPAKWQNKLSGISNRQKSGSMLGVGIMGLLSALIVGPCVTPPLAAAVIYISSNSNGPLVGGLALFAMAMGMGMILLAVGTSAGKWVPRSGGWMNVVKSLFGILLLGMAIWFLSRILDGVLILFMWGVLALASGIMWYRHAIDNGMSGWLAWMLEFLRVLLIVVGVVYIVAALGGRSDPFKPLQGFFSGGGGAAVNQQAQVNFKKVANLEELNALISSSTQPVMLDFYADWCVECKRMEATTFKDPEMVQLSQQFLMLKADVTVQNEADKALMAQFGIIGPPATLFWESGGTPLTRYNFFGYKSAKELIQTFENILK